MGANGNGVAQLTWTSIAAILMVIFTAAGGSYALVQQQFSAIERQFDNATKTNAATLVALRNELDDLRGITIERAEHTEFVKRLDAAHRTVVDQLSVLERTRPTTGELMQVQTNTTKEISEIKDRVRSLEDYLRRAPPAAQPPNNH